MGQNLTGQLISATYEGLVQISGSILTDGTGSDINNLTVTASNAEVANKVYATGSSDPSAYSVLLGDTGFIGDGDTSIIVENAGNLAYNPAINTLYSPIFSGALNGNADTATSASFATTASYAVSSSADNITLQDVTDNGNTTDNFISSSAGFIRKPTSATLAYIQLGNLQENLGNVYFESERDGVDQIRFTSTDTTNAIILNQSGSQNVRLDFNNSAGEIESEGDLILDTRNLGDVIIPSGSLVMANSNEILSDAYKPSGSQAIYYTNNDLGNPTGLNESGLVLTGSASIDVDGANNILLTSTKDTFKVPVEFEQDITGSNATFTNVIVGTISGSTALFSSASIGYLNAVTGSVTTIGDAFILLNTSDVTRYAGLLVEDSGSSTPINYTASFFFDSVTNDWNYEYTSGSTDYGVALFGPTYNTKGSPTYLTANTLPKAEGTHHLIDSIISDDGSVVTVSGDVEATSITASAGFSGDLAGTASFATTASYALNVPPNTGFPYTGSAEISGSLRVLVDGVADGYTITSGSLTGSLIDNLGTPTGSEAIKHLVYLSQTEYDAITPDSNTMYVISGSGDTIGDLTVSGSLVGEVQALSIVSTTASMDCSTGNFFTLQLVSGSNTYINPTNIQAGQTINLLVSTTGSATVSFPSSVKQVSGLPYVPTPTTSKDVVTFISFDSSALYLSNVKNLS